MTAQTPFVETELLLAIMEERPADAINLARTMLPNEIRTLRTQAVALMRLCADVIGEEFQEDCTCPVDLPDDRGDG